MKECFNIAVANVFHFIALLLYYNYTFYEITILVLLVRILIIVLFVFNMLLKQLFFFSLDILFNFVFIEVLTMYNIFSNPSNDRWPVVSTITCFGTLLWNNHVAELRLWDWFAKCPFESYLILSCHLLTFLFPFVWCNATLSLSVWAKHANKMCHF